MHLLLNSSEALIPQMLLVFYKGEINYVESHIISPKGRLLAGRPLSYETAISMQKYLTNLSLNLTPIKGYVNNRIVYCGEGSLAWKFPGKKAKAKIGEGKTMDVYFPKGIFICRDGIFYLYTYDKFAGAGTILYNYPTPNVMPGGNICWGSVKTPTILSFDDINIVEVAFFESNFAQLWPKREQKTKMGKLREKV